MRLLLDESVPRRLAKHLTGVEVDSVHDRKWTGLKNGELLRIAEREYDVLVTTDQNLRHQQNLPAYTIRTVVLAGRTNRLQDLLPLLPKLLEACRTLEQGGVAIVREAGRHPAS